MHYINLLIPVGMMIAIICEVDAIVAIISALVISIVVNGGF